MYNDLIISLMRGSEKEILDSIEFQINMLSLHLFNILVWSIQYQQQLDICMSKKSWPIFIVRYQDFLDILYYAFKGKK